MGKFRQFVGEKTQKSWRESWSEMLGVSELRFLERREKESKIRVLRQERERKQEEQEEGLVRTIP